MTILAFDPGVTGALAVAAGGEFSVEDLPVKVIQKGKKKRRQYDLEQLASLVVGIAGDTKPIVIIEQVGPMPRDGCIQAFTLGRGLGALEGICYALGATVHYVSPAVWKKKMGVTADKNTSLTLAREVYPQLADQLKLKKNDGRAEALLILRYYLLHVLGDPLLQQTNGDSAE